VGRAKPRARIVIKCDPELKKEWMQFKASREMTGEEALRFLLDFYKLHSMNAEVFGNE